jgi:catechol 2,3-dioxygenase-like lactoylglutathione lyase family enzyme
MLHRRFARTFLLIFTVTVFATVATRPRSAVAEQPHKPVLAVTAVGITVGDLDRSMRFYRDVLGFKVETSDEAMGSGVEGLAGVFGAHTRSARMRLGNEAIVLTEYLAPRGRAIPPDLRSNDRAFQHLALVVSDMDRAYAHLRAQHVRHVSTSPQTLPAWNKAAGGIKAFYFADPDEHRLEAIWFPPGKGDTRWHVPPPGQGSGPIFLGIDHTAIVTWDSAASLRLYRDTLGLRVAGTSENHGTEQEHLNNVFGAHLVITGLRADAGPGIELLEYLSPRGGRASPPDLQANDLLHWQTLLSTRDVAATALAARAAGATMVSSEVTDLDDKVARFRRGILLRDPDGHGLLLTE